MKRFVIIGLGSIGRRHMTNLAAQFPGAGFTVVRHAFASDPLCETLGARIVTRLEDALSDRPDLVIVASPSANHIESLPALIAAGVNIMVEKPIVTQIEDCDRLILQLRSAPPAVRVSGFNFRYLPSLQVIRRAIRLGELGQVVRASFVAGQWLPDWRPAQDYRESYSADARRGGGVELDLVHEIDVARWFFGELSLEFAIGGRLSSLGIDANDVSTMVFSAPKGPLVQVALDYVARNRLRHYEIIGDKAGFLWDISGHVDRLTSDGRQRIVDEPPAFNVAQTYIDMLDRIAAAISGSWQEPLQSLEDGIASTRLAIEARDFSGPRAPARVCLKDYALTDEPLGD